MTDRTIGQYRLLERLGEGGMGEVWKAYDPKLQRTVAIKVLKSRLPAVASRPEAGRPPLGERGVARASRGPEPEVSSSETEARRRILREARAASGLSHPNICTVYDVGEAPQSGVGLGDPASDAASRGPGDPAPRTVQSFIVMEHVEGKALSELIPVDGLPSETAVRYGTQIADALAHAHEKGIVHRDLKSANVVITPEGRAKVLDFGVADRLPAADAEAVTRTQASPEGSAPVGTLAYMAPEVLNGHQATVRSDIWSLGVLLYEMVSGRLPFDGTTALDLSSAILKDPPSPLPTRIPAAVRSVIRRCLTKLPGQRYASAAVVQGALEALQTEAVGGGSMSIGAWAALGRVPRFVKIAGTAAVATVVVLLLQRVPLPTGRRRGYRAVPVLSNAVQITVAQGVEDFPTWSPDGGSLAYAAADRAEFRDGNWDIWVTQVGSSMPLNRTADHPGVDSFPSWSPDGLELAFHSSREDEGLFVMSPLTGTPRKVINLEPPMAVRWASSPRWSTDGTQIAFINRMNVDITTLDSGEVRRLPLPGRANSRYDLDWSPDGRHIVYVAAQNRVSNITQLWMVRLSDGEAWPLTDGYANDWSPIWAPDGGSVLFVTNRGGSMDLWRQRVTADGVGEGGPEPITSGIGMRRAVFSPDGSHLAYSRGQRVGNLWRIPIPRDGRPATWADAEQLTFDQALISSVNVSPAGRQLAVASNRTGNTDVWVLPASGGPLRQLTTERTPDWMPVWSPDETRIAFYAFRSGSRQLWTMPADGGRPERVTYGEADSYQPTWSPDGRDLAFYSVQDGAMDIWIVPARGGEPRQLTEVSGRNFFPQWSPDGRSIVFCSIRSGDPRLWRIAVNGGAAEPLSSGPAWYPSWSRAGERVYFTGTGEREGDIWEIDLDGTIERAVTDLSDRPGTLQPAALSNDGAYLFFSWVEDFGDIWVMDVEWDEE